jgi:hypothetical protein
VKAEARRGRDRNASRTAESRDDARHVDGLREPSVLLDPVRTAAAATFSTWRILSRESLSVSDLVESALRVIDPVAHREDDSLPLRKLVKNRFHRASGLLVDGVLERGGPRPVGEGVGQKLLRRRNRGIDRLDRPDRREELFYFGAGEAAALRDLVGACRATQARRDP